MKSIKRTITLVLFYCVFYVIKSPLTTKVDINDFALFLTSFINRYCTFWNDIYFLYVENIKQYFNMNNKKKTTLVLGMIIQYYEK